MGFYCFLVLQTARTGAILGNDEGGRFVGVKKKKKKQESLSFAGEAQTHVVFLGFLRSGGIRRHSKRVTNCLCC